jgi:hypothetical protein
MSDHFAIVLSGSYDSRALTLRFAVKPGDKLSGCQGDHAETPWIHLVDRSRLGLTTTYGCQQALVSFTVPLACTAHHADWQRR